MAEGMKRRRRTQITAPEGMRQWVVSFDAGARQAQGLLVTAPDEEAAQAAAEGQLRARGWPGVRPDAVVTIIEVVPAEAPAWVCG